MNSQSLIDNSKEVSGGLWDYWVANPINFALDMLAAGAGSIEDVNYWTKPNWTEQEPLPQYNGTSAAYNTAYYGSMTVDLSRLGFNVGKESLLFARDVKNDFWTGAGDVVRRNFSDRTSLSGTYTSGGEKFGFLENPKDFASYSGTSRFRDVAKQREFKGQGAEQAQAIQEFVANANYPFKVNLVLEKKQRFFPSGANPWEGFNGAEQLSIWKPENAPHIAKVFKPQNATSGVVYTNASTKSSAKVNTIKTPQTTTIANKGQISQVATARVATNSQQKQQQQQQYVANQVEQSPNEGSPKMLGKLIGKLLGGTAKVGADLFNPFNMMAFLSEDIHGVHAGSSGGSIATMTTGGYNFTVLLNTPTKRDLDAVDDFFTAYGYNVSKWGTPKIDFSKNKGAPNAHFYLQTGESCCTSSIREAQLQLDAMCMAGCRFWAKEIGQ